MSRDTKLDISTLREGDIVFVSDGFPFSWVTQLVTRSKVTHCGQLVDKYSNGRLYIGEMIGDLKKDNDLDFNSLKRYTKKPRWNGKIVAIKRSKVYDSIKTRVNLRKRLRRLKANYNFKALTSYITKAPVKNKKDLICSGLVCYQSAIDGVPWSQALREYAPSPAELYRDNLPNLETVYFNKRFKK